MNGHFDFDIIVVGAGHAGIEASLVSSRLGLNVCLITTNLDRVGYMSCNPSIGGLAKGHMVRELDILGGQMGFAADATCIQFKRLNSGKGPAVRGSRSQCDKELYVEYMRNWILQQPNLSLKGGEVRRLLLNGNLCEGVELSDGSVIRSRAVVITAGTFLNGVMHVGLEQTPGGRVGDKASIGLSDQLRDFGFSVQRLKTGTPARLHRDSIDWSKTEPQPGDSAFYPFSFRSSSNFVLPQVLCYMSRTTVETHEIIRQNLHKSPMYCGIIEGSGPRYCPSIEDKVVRFGDRDGHQTFLEPESLSTDLIYLQGISTSLPADVQMQFLKTIPGLEHVKVARFGYAVEYDFIEPTQIRHTLETRPIRSLFLAGQINGTSGYEEAAAQGFLAGVNAAHSILQRNEFILERSVAYMGVLIDDLVTKGTREPYRMFTSRAEHRLVLREDNTVDRLYEVSKELGVVDDSVLIKMENIRSARVELGNRLSEHILVPNEITQNALASVGTKPLLKPASMADLLRRPEVSFSSLSRLGFEFIANPDITDAVEISVKYSGYISKQNEIISQTKRLEEFIIPSDIDYFSIRGLSNEEGEKLTKVRPRSLGQAQRISGVNPSAIQCILIYLKGRKKIKEMEVGL
jgi:tRNA uridine 5-carboxymethylaminomethyl modification enzyme